MAKTNSPKKLERERQWDVRWASRQFPGMVLWRNNRGVAKYEGKDGKVTSVPYGLTSGASDLIGIYRGVFLACEMKQPGETPTEAQTLFLECVRRAGGCAFVATCEEDFVLAIKARFGE